MRSILRSYFYRLFHEVGFYVQVSICFFIPFLIALIARIALQSNGSTLDPMSEMLLVGLTGGKLMGSSSIPWMSLFFFSIFGAVRYHKETASGAMRNYVVSGYSRSQIYNAFYIGYLVFFLFLSCAITLGVTLPFIGTAWAPQGLNGWDYLLNLLLIVLSDWMLFTFMYFAFVWLKGHGFSGSFGILVYVGLSLFGTIGMLIVLIAGDKLSGDTAKLLGYTLGFFFTSNRGVLAGGNLSASPLGSFSAMGVDTPATRALASVDWKVFNISSCLINAAIFGVGSYFLGLHLSVKRDLK